MINILRLLFYRVDAPIFLGKWTVVMLASEGEKSGMI